jgi:hypothetical protein
VRSQPVAECLVHLLPSQPALDSPLLPSQRVVECLVVVRSQPVAEPLVHLLHLIQLLRSLNHQLLKWQQHDQHLGVEAAVLELGCWHSLHPPVQLCHLVYHKALSSVKAMYATSAHHDTLLTCSYRSPG